MQAKPINARLLDGSGEQELVMLEWMNERY